MKRPENLSGLAAYKKLSPAARRNTNFPTLGKLTPRRPRAPPWRIDLMEAFDTGLHGARPRTRDIGRLGDQTLSTDFRQARLPNVDLTGADLSGSSFVDASLWAVNFSNANLTDVDFTGAVFPDAIFTGAILCRTKLPEGVDNSGC